MIRNKKVLKEVSWALTAALLFQLLFPTSVWALTGGPSQPEVESFEPIGTSEMVDPFTGDFSYNIPLMDVGGYPINIGYHSGITMDQEASWVGLGWNINPGAITRQMRGLPDDFEGDEIENEFNMRKNETYSLSARLGLEVFGMVKQGKRFIDNPNSPLKVNVSFGLGINYNNYEGIGVDISAGAGASLDFEKSATAYGTAGLGLNFLSSSNDGLSISPSISFSQRMGKKIKGLGLAGLSSSLGATFNSRQGIKAYSFGLSADPNINKGKKGDKNQVHLNSRLGTNSSISLLPNTYTPEITFPFESGNYSANFKIGGEIFGFSGTADLLGTYCYQKLISHTKKSSAYGYLHSEEALSDKSSLMDFNREKDGVFTTNTTNLPLTNFTYDVYNINGQGLDGMFRSFRSDVGYVRDPEVRNTSASFNLGLELGVGDLTKVGVNGGANSVNSISGMWQDNNDANSLKYTSRSDNEIREAAYFKLVGEKNTNSKDILGISKTDWWKSELQGDKALQVNLSGDKYDVKADASFKDNSNTSHPFNSIVRDDRSKRNQLVSSLTIGELKKLSYYAGLSDINSLNSGSTLAKDHHIGQIKVVKVDGSRYVYGLPAYNYFTKDATFNVSGESGKDCVNGLINYSDEDASVNNKRGKDRFYQSTKVPAYAHSYLLTSVLSPDYSDFDDVPGPSLGDVGNYVKFEYNTISDYKWRVPYQDHKVAYNEGLKSLAWDDMGNYSYGEKELKYLHKIETKTYVAIFNTSNRMDAKGVNDESGGYGGNSASMQKLDKISLYTQEEYKSYPNATPIMEVHFEYDYSLCPGIPNNPNGGGKLTLKKIYTTYGNSFKAKLNAYNFTYADLDHDGTVDASVNPSYNLKGYDRWGSYAPNIGGCGPQDVLPAFEFPYTVQDKALADVYKAAWSLSSIDLPSGGEIQVDYESDDYAYVQDKRAMQMFQVVGSGDSYNSFNPANPDNRLYDENDKKNPFEYLFIATPDIDGDDTQDSLEYKYFDGLIGEEMYFRFLMDLSNKSGLYDYDYVPGYCKIESVGLVSGVGNGREYAYLKIEKVKTGDAINNSANANPISVATWNFTRLHNADLAFSVKPKNSMSDPGSIANPGAAVEDVFTEMLSSFKNFADVIQGANGSLRSRRFGQKFVIGKSWIRLENPVKRKFGGDVRVKQLKLLDKWDDMTTSGSTSSYGQVYSYTLKDGSSSGVAAYEPIIGGDENPFHQPVFFTEDRLLAPDDEHYVTKPFGESFFPAPSVGYSRVEVKNLPHSGVTKHATGKTVYEFYTAKDFPTKVDHTGLQVKHKPPSFLSSMLKFSVKDYMQTSQGYVIEKNDMHGKPKATWVYAEGESDYQSGVEYKYSTMGNELNNQVPVLFKDNTISEDLEIGADYDLVNDFRHSNTESKAGGLDFNGDMFLVSILPIEIPIIIPSYNKSVNQYRSVVTTKVVTRYAIPTKTKVYNEKSVVTTENLLWDAETGDVLLTKVNNQYDDPVYNFKYPAHFAYEGMAGGYQNEGYSIKDRLLTFNTPFVSETESDVFSHFHEGDKVLLTISPENFMEAWVIKGYVDPGGEGYYLIDKEGAPIPGKTGGANLDGIHDDLDGMTASEIKIIRSGYRNVNGTIGQVTLKHNPIVEDNGVKSIEFGESQGISGVVSASVNEYTDHWQAGVENYNIDGNPVTVSSVDCAPDISKIQDIENALTSLIQNLASHGYFDGTTYTISETNFNSKGDNLISLIGTANINTLVNNFSPQLDNVSTSTDPLYLKVSSGSSYGDGYMQFRLYRGAFHEWYPYLTMGLVSLNPNINLSVNPIINISDIEFVVCSGSGIYPAGTGLAISNAKFTPYISDGYFENLLFGYSEILPFVTHSCAVYNKLVHRENNPYVDGARGCWRPYKTWAPLVNRLYGSSGLNLREDGQLFPFSPFWKMGQDENWESYEANWTLASTVTKYDQCGNEVENKDALGKYSTALYGYSSTLPVAVSKNAQWGQIASVNFEDDGYPRIPNQQRGYLDYNGNAASLISDEESHTGKYSLKIAGASSNLVLFDIGEPGFHDVQEGCLEDNDPHLFVPQSCDELNTFFQFSGSGDNHKFLVSYWVKQQSSTASDYTDFDLQLVQSYPLSSATASEIVIGKSKVIDGWQKIDKEIDINLNGSTHYKFQIILTNNSSNAYYLDDLRIQPERSSMKTFVYNPLTLKLSSQLDENNYATFYEYDEDGALVRVKKETERGIMTLSENRSHLVKN